MVSLNFGSEFPDIYKTGTQFGEMNMLMLNMKILAVSLLMNAIVVYKVIGSEDSISEYVQTCEQTTNDWSGIYFQLSIEHAEEAIYYRCDKYKTGKLMKAEIRQTSHIEKISDVRMCNPGITGAEKASIVKELLGMDANTVLLRDMLYDCIFVEEHVDQYELIVPHHKVQSVIVHEEIIKVYDFGKICR